MAKFKIKEAASVALGATGGAYLADFINDMIDEKIEDEKVEIGVKLALVAAGSYVATTQKGIMQTASISAIGQFGKGIADSVKNMMSDQKPTKGLEEEIGSIHDELMEAMKGHPGVYGNEPQVAGNNPIVSGNYPDDQD